MAHITDLPPELLTTIFKNAMSHPNALGLRLLDYRTARSLISVNSRFCEVSVHIASSMNRSMVARRYWRVAERITRDRERGMAVRAKQGRLAENP